MRFLFHEFSQKTGIKALAFAANSKFSTERWFWYIMIVFGSLLTILDLKENVENFLSGPTGTKIILVSNSTIEMGEPTLCLNFNVSKMRLYSLSVYEASELFKHFNKSLLMSDLPLNEKLEINPYFHLQLSLVITLLTDISMVEQSVLTYEELKNFTDNITNKFKYSTSSSYIVHKSLKDLNMSLKSVIRAVGVNLCRLINLEVEFGRYDVEKEKWTPKEKVCAADRITWMGTAPQYGDIGLLCLKLPGSIFKFASNQDTTTIIWEEQNFYLNLSYSQLPDSYSPYGTLDFSQCPTRLHIAGSFLWIPYNTHHTVGLSVLGEYKKITKPSSPCGTRKLCDCLMETRALFFRKHCGCTPFMDGPTDQYSQCGEIRDSITSVFVPGYNYSNPKCQKIKFNYYGGFGFECIHPCHYSSLSFYYMDGSYAKNTQNVTRLELFAHGFTFHLIEEIPMITTKMFLGSIGGNLSLYLGMSFLVLLHVFVFWFSQLFDHLYTKCH